ncbi:unnamed protein product [Paramecium primaurelia]|uniref:Uncharacterized protein n=1 Tax=Paramecium primaurelia TaxID=5886 RepID=A0A8S1MU77_PARPR|nr:unnamed protein product [Paramecium primaurelia]
MSKSQKFYGVIFIMSTLKLLIQGSESQKGLMIIFLTYNQDCIIKKETLISLILGVYLELSLKYSRVFEGEDIQIWINLADCSKQNNRVSLLQQQTKFFTFLRQINNNFKNYLLQIGRQKYMKKISSYKSEKSRPSQRIIILDGSLNYSKNNQKSFVLENQQNRVDQMAEIFYNQIQRSQKATPNLQSEKYIKDESEE